MNKLIMGHLVEKKKLRADFPPIYSLTRYLYRFKQQNNNYKSSSLNCKKSKIVMIKQNLKF